MQESYLLHIDDNNRGRSITLSEFPGLKAVYVADENHICSLYYGADNVRCAAKGSVNLTLTINDHPDIVIDSEDETKGHATIVGEYEFRGNGIVIRHESREETYLLFTVTHFALGSGSDSGLYGTETRSYRANETFMIEFTESGGTGHTWQLDIPLTSCNALELVQHQYIPHCKDTYEDDQRATCVNTHRFILKTLDPLLKGDYTLNAIYSRSWEEDADKRKVGRRTRQFKITLL